MKTLNLFLTVLFSSPAFSSNVIPNYTCVSLDAQHRFIVTMEAHHSPKVLYATYQDITIPGSKAKGELAVIDGKFGPTTFKLRFVKGETMGDVYDVAEGKVPGETNGTMEGKEEADGQITALITYSALAPQKVELKCVDNYKR